MKKTGGHIDAIVVEFYFIYCYFFRAKPATHADLLNKHSQAGEHNTGQAACSGSCSSPNSLPIWVLQLLPEWKLHWKKAGEHSRAVGLKLEQPSKPPGGLLKALTAGP